MNGKKHRTSINLGRAYVKEMGFSSSAETYAKTLTFMKDSQLIVCLLTYIASLLLDIKKSMRSHEKNRKGKS
jgi:hypothetical protein